MLPIVQFSFEKKHTWTSVRKSGTAPLSTLENKRKYLDSLRDDIKYLRGKR
jgi:hypothetical protein